MDKQLAVLLWLVCCCVSWSAFASKNLPSFIGVDIPANLGDDGPLFPTSETEVNSWVFSNPANLNSQYRHGWGLWNGLTQKADTTGAVGVDDPLVYQTWWSPRQIIHYARTSESPYSFSLRAPRQHHHGGAGPSILDVSQFDPSNIIPDLSVAEVVAYNPASVRHVYNNKLLFTEALDGYLEEGYTSIPRFPNNAVNIKPVYKLITKEKLMGGLYAMPAWPGTPDTSKWNGNQKEQGFGPALWKQCVYVDPENYQPSRASAVDINCNHPDGSNIYSLGDFIHIKIDPNYSAFYEDEFNGAKIALNEGDILLLVGMHVTTRETERWTWQTFWWSATPDRPNAPSSPEIAQARLKTFQNPAASHYAMSVAYSMLMPAQPLNGGYNSGELVPAYNPHLEAGFGTATFGLTTPVATEQGTVVTNLGVQSNCMTCHGLAGYKTMNPTYASDFYIPRNDSALSGGLDVDFAWSIPNEAVSGSVP